MKLNCKLCSSQIKLIGHNLICSNCGWHKQSHTKVSDDRQKQVAQRMAIAGIILMGLFSYVGYFGSHSVEIIPLKVKQVTNSLNENSHNKLVKICMKLKQYDCVEKAHTSYFASSRNLEVLSTLGSFQFRRNKLKEASLTYSRYFELKGKDFRTAYNYARTLEKLGQTNKALKYYEYSIYSKSVNKLHVTAMRDYINLLVTSNQTHKAQQALIKLQPSIQNASALVQQEYSRWQERVKRG